MGTAAKNPGSLKQGRRRDQENLLSTGDRMTLGKKALWLVLWLASPLARADDAADADRLFAHAEARYSRYFSPAAQPTQSLQGYLVRYYPDTNTYLGVRDGDVYVYGQVFGVGILRVGRLSEFIEVSPADITDLLLTRRSPDCATYAGYYTASARDVARNLNFTGSLAIAVSNGSCTFTSNNIPNHPMGQGGAFATPVSAQNSSFRVSATPAFAAQNTPISLTWNNAVLLNGVRVDMFAAACFGVGDGRIGCNNDSQPWRYDPMSPRNSFGTDVHNAHTQPDGAYHYHGNPLALFDLSGNALSPVVGFAADGFPLYGPFIASEQGGFRKARSSYRLKAGNRPTGSGNPGGVYDGTYRDDYEFVSGLGDLDACNGMTVAGSYGYYITDAFPYMNNCFRGTPDPSFRKGAAPPR